MVYSLLCLIITVLCVKIILMKKSAREIVSELSDRLQTDTNTLLHISSHDRDMRFLADSSLRDDLLRKMTAQVLGMEVLDEIVFSEQIDHLDVDADMISFCFRDGHTVIQKWIPPKKEGHKWTESQREKMKVALSASWTPERREEMSVRAKEMRRREKLAKNH